MQRVGGSSPRSLPGGWVSGWAAGSWRPLSPHFAGGALEPREPLAGRRCTSCMRVGLSARGGRWLSPSWTRGLPAVRGGAPAARHSLPDPSGGPSRTSRAWEAPPPAVRSTRVTDSSFSRVPRWVSLWPFRKKRKKVFPAGVKYKSRECEAGC